jgi:membrane peptidoglycan carboxypeptidase
VIRDEKSTNGLYRQNRRIQETPLYHNDVISLGPPELASVVRLRFSDPPPLFVRVGRYGIYGMVALVSLVTLWLGLEWNRFSVNPLPIAIQGPVVVFARDGQTPLVPPTNETHRELKQLIDFSANLPKAVIASEDSRYYWHLGVDPLGMLRAFIANLQGGEIREGASTITQQLARSLFREYVGKEDSLGRKLKEMVVALKLEASYSKDFLMLTYLNQVFLGRDHYGFEDASRFYFDKSAKDLTLSEAATLVGILPAPNRFNPVRDYQYAVEYRDRVLNRMGELGLVSQEEAQRARRSRIELSPKAREQLQSTKAPYFHEYVFLELDQLLGSDLAREGNFIVQTGLDLGMQAKAESNLLTAVNEQGAVQGFSQGAIATVDANTGEIRALVGG